MYVNRMSSSQNGAGTSRRQDDKADNGTNESGFLTGRWTKQEHEKFLQGLKQYGREWKKVALTIKTRSSAQIRSHAQKYFAKLAKEKKTTHGIGTHPKRSSSVISTQSMSSVASSPNSPQTSNGSGSGPSRTRYAGSRRLATTSSLKSKRAFEVPFSNGHQIQSSASHRNGSRSQRFADSGRMCPRGDEIGSTDVMRIEKDLTSLIVRRNDLVKSWTGTVSVNQYSSDEEDDSDVESKSEDTEITFDLALMQQIENKIAKIDLEIANLYTEAILLDSAKGHERAVATALLNYIFPNQVQIPTCYSASLMCVKQRIDMIRGAKKSSGGVIASDSITYLLPDFDKDPSIPCAKYSKAVIPPAKDALFGLQVLSALSVEAEQRHTSFEDDKTESTETCIKSEPTTTEATNGSSSVSQEQRTFSNSGAPSPQATTKRKISGRSPSDPTSPHDRIKRVALAV